MVILHCLVQLSHDAPAYGLLPIYVCEFPIMLPNVVEAVPTLRLNFIPKLERICRRRYPF